MRHNERSSVMWNIIAGGAFGGVAGLVLLCAWSGGHSRREDAAFGITVAVLAIAALVIAVML